MIFNHIWWKSPVLSAALLLVFCAAFLLIHLNLLFWYYCAWKFDAICLFTAVHSFSYRELLFLSVGFSFCLLLYCYSWNYCQHWLLTGVHPSSYTVVQTVVIFVPLLLFLSIYFCLLLFLLMDKLSTLIAYRCTLILIHSRADRSGCSSVSLSFKFFFSIFKNIILSVILQE